MNTKQLRKKVLGGCLFFALALFFAFYFILFYFIHQHGINVSSAVFILFCFCTMASHLSGYFGLCSVRFPSVFVFPCHQFFTTVYYYYHYCYYYCNPKFWSSYYEIHDNFGILLGCIGGYQIKLVLAQITTFFSSFPLFLCFLLWYVLGYIFFALFVVRDSKRLLLSRLFSFFPFPFLPLEGAPEFLP